MRTSEHRLVAIVLIALSAACSSSPEAGAGTGVAAVPCARGDEALASRCTVERTTTPAGPVLTLRAPDGGFHRLLVVRDGRGLVAADGAEPAAIVIVGPRLIDVGIGGDRYRLPATSGAAK